MDKDCEYDMTKDQLWNAWQKLEEMRANCCCIEIASDYDYVWDMTITVNDGTEDHVPIVIGERRDEHGTYVVPFPNFADMIEAAYKVYRENVA